MSNKLNDSYYLANCHLSILRYFEKDDVRLARSVTAVAGLVATTLGAHLSYKVLKVGAGLLFRCSLPVCGLLAATSFAAAYLLKPTTKQSVKKVWVDAIHQMENVNYSEPGLVPLAIRAGQIGATQLDNMVWAIDLLESRHANFGIRDDQGNTPLHWSIADTCPEMSHRLICAIGRQNPIFFESQDDSFGGHTPLTLLVKQGYRTHDRDGKQMAYSNDHLVNLILTINPSSLNIPHRLSRLTPLEIAVIKRDLPMILTLRRHGARITRERFNELMSRYSHLNPTIDFLRERFDPLFLMHVPMFEKNRSVKVNFKHPKLQEVLERLLFTDELKDPLPEIDYQTIAPKFQWLS